MPVVVEAIGILIACVFLLFGSVYLLATLLCGNPVSLLCCVVAFAEAFLIDTFAEHGSIPCLIIAFAILVGVIVAIVVFLKT